METPRKLPSGKWNIQVFDYKDENGSKHFKSFTDKSKTVVLKLAMDFKKERAKRDPQIKRSSMTVGEALDNYIDLCSQLSPTSVSSYKGVRRTSFQKLMDEKIDDLSDEKVQRYIDLECKRTTRRNQQISPKTIKDNWNLVATAIKKESKKTFDVKLPKMKPKFVEYPDPQIVIEAIKNTDIELPCMLALWLSFTMSEIRGIKCSSIKDNVLYIKQVVVDVDGERVVKENAKVDTRNRKHIIPEYIMGLFYENEIYANYLKTGKDDFVIQDPAYHISHTFKKLMKDRGVDLTFHGLRHLNASIMLQLNVPTKYAMERGGWKTDSTLKQVYQHTFSEKRIEIDHKINNFFKKSLHEVCTKKLNLEISSPLKAESRVRFSLGLPTDEKDEE